MVILFIDAVVKNKQNEDDNITIGFIMIPETNQQFFTLSVGSLNKGVGVLNFGEEFNSPELLQIMNEVPLKD